jgi:hypothetical protein
MLKLTGGRISNIEYDFDKFSGHFGHFREFHRKMHLTLRPISNKIFERTNILCSDVEYDRNIRLPNTKYSSIEYFSRLTRLDRSHLLAHQDDHGGRRQPCQLSISTLLLSFLTFLDNLLPVCRLVLL